MTKTQTTKLLNNRIDDIIKLMLQGQIFDYDNQIFQLNYEYLIDGVNESKNLQSSITENLRDLASKKTSKMFRELNSIDILQLEEKVKGIKDRYNDSWLDTEKAMIKRRVREIRTWNNYTRFPESTITWVTSKDEKVRDSHRELDGLTLPVNHDFWKSTTPSSFYGCRCTLKHNIVPVEKTSNLDIPNIEPEQPGNTYFDGKIFNVDKMYN